MRLILFDTVTFLAAAERTPRFPLSQTCQNGDATAALLDDEDDVGDDGSTTVPEAPAALLRDSASTSASSGAPPSAPPPAPLHVRAPAAEEEKKEEAGEGDEVGLDAYWGGPAPAAPLSPAASFQGFLRSFQVPPLSSFVAEDDRPPPNAFNP